MVRVGILGATGYTALELIKILLHHDEVEIVALTSRQEGNPHVAAIHPQLAGRLDMQLEDLEPSQVAARCDCIFSCLPHGASATVVRQLLDAGKRVVNFSADYRLTDAGVYADWYGQKHADPDRVGHAVYGLPEIYGNQIADAAVDCESRLLPHLGDTCHRPAAAGQRYQAQRDHRRFQERSERCRPNAKADHALSRV